MNQLRKKTFVFQLILLFFLSSHVCAQQTGRTQAKQFKNNVVQLFVSFSSGEDCFGFGFVIGERDNKLFIVTAEHVVRSEEPDVETKAIQVRFEKEKGKSYSARLLGVAHSNMDLALLEMPKPFKAAYWGRLNYNPNPEEGDLVWFIGRNAKWYVPTDKGAGVISEIDTINHTLIVEIYSVKPGSSGAPLFGEKGIVGMITEDSGDEVNAIDIGTIKAIVTQKWRYPWHGSSYKSIKPHSSKSAKPEPVGFTFENEKEIIHWGSNEDEALIKQSGKYATTGSYALRADLPKTDFPSIMTRKFPRDWSKYTRLTANIFMTGSAGKMEEFSVRIDDIKSTSFNSRFTWSTGLPQGANKIDISIEEIGKAIDITQIQMVVFFLYNPKGKTTLYFDDIRLE